MGSQSFQTTSKGRNAQDAYNRAVERAEDEYGHQQGYSGEINSSAGYRDVTNQYEASGLPLYNFIEKRMDQLTKFDGAECICTKKPIENKNKIKSHVQNLATPGTKKWVLLYCVYEAWSDRFIGSFDKKADAIKRAREIAEKQQAEVHIKMEKKLDKGVPLVAKITYKKATNEREGEYIFYGWASC